MNYLILIPKVNFSVKDITYLKLEWKDEKDHPNLAKNVSLSLT